MYMQITVYSPLILDGTRKLVVYGTILTVR